MLVLLFEGERFSRERSWCGCNASICTGWIRCGVHWRTYWSHACQGTRTKVCKWRKRVLHILLHPQRQKLLVFTWIVLYCASILVNNICIMQWDASCKFQNVILPLITSLLRAYVTGVAEECVDDITGVNSTFAGGRGVTIVCMWLYEEWITCRNVN